MAALVSRVSRNPGAHGQPSAALFSSRSCVVTQLITGPSQPARPLTIGSWVHPRRYHHPGYRIQNDLWALYGTLWAYSTHIHILTPGTPR
ncbi:hypothetical protein KQX54_016195 [Cotesia glomerata]|uniref:Uncharacterized protein n=1 Tax=Cotesia glomerata TaxID=32391 RepID=A0AAV7HXG9_COTGL|nr:hypothetical protein KQX54_016195 [Cotesia glomerata]